MARPLIVSIIGARPQFIKLAPVAAALANHKLNHVVIHTGQHHDFQMSEVFFRDLMIPPPKYHLGISGGNHGEQTGLMLQAIETVLLKVKPSMVLVFGDTNSTIAGALSAAKLHIPLAHVEAGMRSYNLHMPEEVNRVVTDHLATLHFCASQTAVTNLKNEGVTKNIFFTGDVMADLLLIEAKRLRPPAALSGLPVKPGHFLLLTIHRAQNTDDPDQLKILIKTLAKISQPVIFPVHPRTIRRLKEYTLLGSLRRLKHVQVIEPLAYPDMLWFEKNAATVLTDSGGVQKEAFLFEVPCITLREETEWTETVKTGWNILTGMNQRRILAALHSRKRRRSPGAPYGRGQASQRIASLMHRYLTQHRQG